jgi:hypothetical protein
VANTNAKHIKNSISLGNSDKKQLSRFDINNKDIDPPNNIHQSPNNKNQDEEEKVGNNNIQVLA